MSASRRRSFLARRRSVIDEKPTLVLSEFELHLPMDRFAGDLDLAPT